MQYLNNLLRTGEADNQSHIHTFLPSLFPEYHIFCYFLDKSYYPYPAYGTCDQSLSHQGSTSEYQVQKNTLTKPEDVPILDGAGTHHVVSNSAPVIDSKLQKVRNHLSNKNNVMEGNIPRRSLNSLANVERQSSRSLLEGYQGQNDSDSSLLIKPNPKSFTESTITSRSSDIESLTNKKRKPSKKKPESKKLAQEPPSDKAKGSDTDINKAPSLKSIEKERKESVNSVEKNRIVSATPTRNMTSRQVWDNDTVRILSMNYFRFYVILVSGFNNIC